MTTPILTLAGTALVLALVLGGLGVAYFMRATAGAQGLRQRIERLFTRPLATPKPAHRLHYYTAYWS
jgi:hypothetical protein